MLSVLVKAKIQDSDFSDMVMTLRKEKVGAVLALSLPGNPSCHELNLPDTALEFLAIALKRLEGFIIRKEFKSVRYFGPDETRIKGKIKDGEISFKFENKKIHQEKTSLVIRIQPQYAASASNMAVRVLGGIKDTEVEEVDETAPIPFSAGEKNKACISPLT